ncbi:efflux RND transporter periplasmic adaptor subunit [Stenotrophobium rhamnosiphilum]|uniref:efflux RND transporter periplasmic adaptor subunit n=1 Tax=Stenotrophobium rhamnosiphilum TaxID=2029166 RepID=UPI001374EB6E|nr:efflux RND transporter periplasmic adaptor subunit [Stenotrophobium rhamnosiphilum]
MSKPIIGRIAAVFLVGMAVTLLPACKGKTAEATVAKPVMAVELVSPKQESWGDEITASGEVTPWQEAIIGAEVGGVRLDEVRADVGDQVSKGQLLARYSEDVLRANLLRQDAAVAEAQANLAKAAADVVRADKLAESNALSAQVIMGYHTQAQVAEAMLASAKAQQRVQALQLRYARVVAPDDGVISSRSATVGSVGMVGVELFRLVRKNRLEWRAQVPAAALTRLKAGMAVTLTAVDGSKVTGKLRQVSPTVDAKTRNGFAYVDLPAASGLSAGVFVTGRFALDKRDALTLPETAVVLRDGNRYLMKVDAQNRVHEVKVDTGRRQSNAIEILGNVAISDRLILSGGAFVANGDLVTVIAAAGKPAP